MKCLQLTGKGPNTQGNSAVGSRALKVKYDRPSWLKRWKKYQKKGISAHKTALGLCEEVWQPPSAATDNHIICALDRTDHMDHTLYRIKSKGRHKHSEEAEKDGFFKQLLEAKVGTQTNYHLVLDKTNCLYLFSCKKSHKQNSQQSRSHPSSHPSRGC